MFHFIPLALAASLLFAETPIMWNVNPHQSTIKKDTIQDIYILVNFEVPESAKQKKRNPVNISLVIDRSGSMGEDNKMQHAIGASQYLVNHLNDKDVLSVIEYDNKVTILQKQEATWNNAILANKLGALSPRGGTNLSGGMLAGFAEVETHKHLEYINRVILLSDGNANQGIRQPHKIYAAVRNAKKNSTSISTIGMGIDYNEDLMQGIAEHGGGRYYYVESTSQMKRIFQEELSRIFTTAAKDVSLEIQTLAGATQANILGQNAKIVKSISTLEIEDFYSGENRSFIIKVKANGLNSDIAQIKLKYTNPNDKKTHVLTSTIKVKLSQDEKEITAARNDKVFEEAKLMEIDLEHKKVLDQYEKGNVKQAKGILKQLNLTTASFNADFKSQSISKKIEALELEEQDMEEASMDLKEHKRYIKSRKNIYKKAMKGKRDKYILGTKSKGMQVENMQKTLKNKGFYQGPIDGNYNQQLKQAVTKFQNQQNLTADGVAGPKTLRALGLY